MGDFQLPEKFEVKSVEKKGLTYVHGNSRFIGLMFQYNDYQYIYRYPDDFNDEEGGEMGLFGRISVTMRHDKQLGMTDQEFRIIEAITIDGGFVVCTLVRFYPIDVAYYVSKDLQHVAIKLYNHADDVRFYDTFEDDAESIL